MVTHNPCPFSLDISYVADLTTRNLRSHAFRKRKFVQAIFSHFFCIAHFAQNLSATLTTWLSILLKNSRTFWEYFGLSVLYFHELTLILFYYLNICMHLPLMISYLISCGVPRFLFHSFTCPTVVAESKKLVSLSRVQRFFCKSLGGRADVK